MLLGKAHVDPLPKWPIVRLAPGEGAQKKLLDEHVVTFTLQLPFPLGISEDTVFTVQPFGAWADNSTAAKFGEEPWVIMRFCNVNISDYSHYPQLAHTVMEKHYGYTMSEDDVVFGSISNAYEQWVSLETPNIRLDTESRNDHAFAFHCCLEALSNFLRAHYFVYRDNRVRSITTHDIGTVVFMGEFKSRGKGRLEWVYAGPLIMHPEFFALFPENRNVGDDAEKLSAAYNLLDQHPFYNSREWLRRADYAKQYTGDSVDVIVSLQTSMESMLYATWRMMLIDLGKSSVQIANIITADSPYRPLLVRIFPQLLVRQPHLLP
jgi:hypothetical protein